MQLTDGERLIVVMLAEVMEALKIDREIDPGLVKTLACNHEDWALAHKYPGIFGGKPRDPEIAKETSDLLWMWGIIEDSIANLSGAEAATAASWHWNSFRGFDGNNDEHFGVAHTLINDLGAFSQFKTRDLNSHSRGTLPHYRTMYGKFMSYIDAGKANPLDFAALQSLCS